MLKLLGYLSIMIGCTVFGIESGKEIYLRRKELEELHKFFMLFQLELRLLKTPVKEILLKLVNKVDLCFKEWVEEIIRGDDFEECWINAINTHFKESYLTSEERNELKQLGKNMGCPEAISLYLSGLELLIQNTREEEKEKKKLYRSMGIMGGIFLVILLL